MKIGFFFHTRTNLPNSVVFAQPLLATQSTKGPSGISLLRYPQSNRHRALLPGPHCDMQALVLRQTLKFAVILLDICFNVNGITFCRIFTYLFAAHSENCLVHSFKAHFMSTFTGSEPTMTVNNENDTNEVTLSTTIVCFYKGLDNL